MSSRGKLVDFAQTHYPPRQIPPAFWKRAAKVGKDAPNANFNSSTWMNHQDQQDYFQSSGCCF